MLDVYLRFQPWTITLVLHNWPIIIYSLLILWSAVRAYSRPTRSALLFLYGLLILAAAFEYQKHGLGPVQETMDYLFAPVPTMQRTGQWLFLNALPAAAYLFGGLLVLLSQIEAWRRSTRRDDTLFSKRWQGFR